MNALSILNYGVPLALPVHGNTRLHWQSQGHVQTCF
jgi:hypothetical protein